MRKMAEQTFIQKWIIDAIFIIFLMPVFIGMFFPKDTGSEEFFHTYASEDTLQDMNDSYFAFTQGTGSNTEMPWTLTGIYTPYTGGGYRYSPDGWLYGGLVDVYSPSQYNVTETDQANDPGKYPMVTYDSRYRVTYQAEQDGSHVYRYLLSGSGPNPSLNLPGNTTQDGHVDGDLYTYVTMDVNQQSDIFFTDTTPCANSSGPMIQAHFALPAAFI